MLPLEPMDPVALEASLTPYIRLYLEAPSLLTARLLASEASAHTELRVAGEVLRSATPGDIPGGEEDAVRAVARLTRGRMRAEASGAYVTVYYGGSTVAVIDGSAGPDVLGRLMVLGGPELLCSVVGGSCEPVGEEAVRVKGVGLVEVEGLRLSVDKRLSELGWRPRRRPRAPSRPGIALGEVEEVTVSLAGTLHRGLEAAEDADERLVSRLAALVASSQDDPIAALYLYIYAAVDEQSRTVRRLLARLVPPRVRAVVDPVSLVADYGVWWRAVDGAVVESGPASPVKVVCVGGRCAYAEATTPTAARVVEGLEARETSIRTVFGALVAGAARIPGLDESVYKVVDETAIAGRGRRGARVEAG